MQDNTINENRNGHLSLLGGFLTYVWLFLGLFFLFLLIAPHIQMSGSSEHSYMASQLYLGDQNVRLVMAALLFCMLTAAVVLVIKRKMTTGKALVLIVLAGIVLRFGTMLYTPFYVHGHDVGSFNGYGHLAYVFRLFKTGLLPDSYGGQFYHPPIAHIADAAVVRLYAFITGQTYLDGLFEAAKLVPCFASCALLFVCQRLFVAFGLSKRASLIAMAAIAFHPTFILMSSSINNDMLMIFFMMAAFLYTVRWYKDQSYKNILLTAVFIGCAMSTKFSGALVSFFTAAVFLIVFIQRLKKKNAIALVAQFGAFALVCFPLGLWYYVRNLLRFGQPFGYVAQVGTDSALYVGNYTASERFLSFDLSRLFTAVFCDPWTDFNLWEYTVKCALFGEFTFSAAHKILAVVLIASSLVLILLSLFAMVRFVFFGNKENRLASYSVAALWLLLMLSFVYFNIKYPFGCTMDFRYIVPTIITGAAFLGLLSERISKGRGKMILNTALMSVLTVFCIASAVFYII